MKNKKPIRILVLGLFAAILLNVVAARADEWDKATLVTIDKPISIPGMVLPPGSYLFKLANATDRNIVRVFTSDRRRLLTTIFAIPDRRVQRTEESVFTFWETPNGRPVALRSWFYPSDYRGFQFRYPERQANSIAAQVNQPVPVLRASK
jgi:hypothetical protein